MEFLLGERMLALFALWPVGPLFHPWQLVTYAFLHEPNNLMHIIFNMFALYMFGGAMEMYWAAPGRPYVLRAVLLRQCARRRRQPSSWC